MPVESQIINRKTEKIIRLGNFIGMYAELCEQFNRDEEKIKELISSPKLINILPA